LTKKDKPLNDYLRYSGLALQLIVLLLAGMALGRWLDRLWPSEQPWFTLLFTLLGLVSGLYQLLRDLLKKS
jgi:F0F1-type ATP synthase assembly protein I